MNTGMQGGDGQELYDLETVRREARESLDSGPVTEDYPLDVNRACQLLNEALASEILCVLRYRHHQVVAKGIDWPQVAAQFEEHGNDEQQHMLMIAERIDQLGGDPDMNPANVTGRATTQYGTTGSLAQMIRDDLVSERVVIEVYRKQIEWFGMSDPTSRRMLEKILEDEEDHARDLADLLAAVDPNTEPR